MEKSNFYLWYKRNSVFWWCSFSYQEGWWFGDSHPHSWCLLASWIEWSFLQIDNEKGWNCLYKRIFFNPPIKRDDLNIVPKIKLPKNSLHSQIFYRKQWTHWLQNDKIWAYNYSSAKKWLSLPQSFQSKIA